MTLPNHIGIIMDGNGRYAKSIGKSRTHGHKIGVERAEDILLYASQKQINAVTLYAFSTENWGRPKSEVSFLMKLPELFFKRFLKVMIDNNMVFKVIGSRGELKANLVKLIENAEEKTKDNSGMIVYLAFNYGGQQEIVSAIQNAAKSGENMENITIESFSKYIFTPEYPNVDLLIRTSGEQRVSNFLLWQIAYAEIYYTNIYWPLFDRNEFDKALVDYGLRNRRFGKVDEHE